MPVAIFVVFIIAALVFIWGLKKMMNPPVAVITLSDDEVVELVAILADWVEMAALRQVNDVRILNDTEYEQSLIKLEDTVKAFQEKF